MTAIAGLRARITRAIPFLLVSGEMRAPPVCADGFLEKPFNAAVLCAHVERLLATRSSPSA